MIVEKQPFQAALPTDASPSDFVRDIVAADLTAKRYEQVHTRFPPEPNGYLHVGHAKAILLNFGVARQFGGICNLRYDDTNPTKEKLEYVDSILEDVSWLIEGWADDYLGLKQSGEATRLNSINGKPDFFVPAVLPKDIGADAKPQNGFLARNSETAPGYEPFYTSDYFDQIYAYAVQLIRRGSAYVCDLSAQEMAAYRGAPNVRGKNSPFRSRPVEDNLALFTRMRNGEFSDGERTLRAKIDMAAPNVWMRDPILYRIRNAEHHRTGRKWPIYPMYDFAHCLSDYIEGVTHSLCTLEFEVHRPLYDWILRELELPRPVPHQYEFARFDLSYTVMSKRKLMQLVSDGAVSGWDDPRLPTIRGIRRRGVTARTVRTFVTSLSITRYKSFTQVEAWEHAIRAELNKLALRRFVVLRPLKVVITNYLDTRVEYVSALENPEDPEGRTREIPLSRTIYIEQNDFAEAPLPGYTRLRPGGEVRLKFAYIIRCDQVIKNAAGGIVELHCTADLESKTGGNAASRQMKAALHWVSAAHAIAAEVRLYERLFTVPAPDDTGNFRSFLNPKSVEVVIARCEPSLDHAQPQHRYQFERHGYFALDPESAPGKLVFNRTVALKNKWAEGNERRPPRRSSSHEAQPKTAPAPTADVARDPAAEPAHGKSLITISGRLVRTARVREEYYRDAPEIDALIATAKTTAGGADILTFIQRPPQTSPEYRYHFEWEGLAALPLITFDHWWKHQISKETRRKIERAERAGVVLRHVELSDDLARGITAIFNETPVKRGKPNRHYGKNLATVREEMKVDLHRSDFIGAFYEEELIGFVKLLYADRLASPVLNLAMFAHRDKMTNYALMAEVVRSSVRKKLPLVFYGIWKSRRQGMREFLESNGFKQVDVPRFYVPLNRRGALFLRLGLHKHLLDLIPDKVLGRLIAWRAKWYAMSFPKRFTRR